MTQIGKLNEMFYEVNKDLIRLEVVDKSEYHPDVHITAIISTYGSDYWKFILETVVEAKEDKLETIRNEDGDYNSNDIVKATQQLEYLRGIEKAVEFMIPKKEE